MSKKKLGPGVYTRGFETLGHYLSMLRSSVRIHLAISILGGLVIGTIWFYLDQNEAARENLSQYVKAAVLSGLSETKQAEYNLGNDTTKMSSGTAYRHLKKEVFGTRTGGFLARQLAFRLVLCSLCLLLVSTFLVAGFGRRLSEEEHRRGSIIQDVHERASEGRRTSVALVLASSIVLGSSFFLLCLGSDGRAQFGNYFWSSLYQSFGPAAKLASPDFEGLTAWYSGPRGDGFYPNETIYRSLRTHVYSGTGMAWLALRWALTVTALAVGGLLLTRKLKRDATDTRSLKIAGVYIPKSAECSHFLFCGSPGSGKSTAIKEILDQVRKRGERAIVFDPSGEYINPYHRGGTDVILNPLDARSEAWTLWADAREKTDYATIARSLFPMGGKDPFWNDAGAALFAAAAEKLAGNGASNLRLYELLTTASIADLAKFMKGTSASKFMDPSAGAMPANLIATVTSRLTAWKLLAEQGGVDHAFSIRKFVEDESSDSWMFLAMRQDHQASLRPLVSLWCDLASTAILSLEPSRSRRFWVVLDEVASLQRLPALPPLLAQGRKHGAAVVLGLQSMAQLRDSYGQDAAAALASQPQTWLSLRTVEPDTARWLESAIGEAEVEETREAVSMGADKIRDGVSIQQNIRKRAAAMASEIMTLPDLEGFLKVPGNSPIHRVRLEVRKRPSVSPMYVPKNPASPTK